MWRSAHKRQKRDPVAARKGEVDRRKIFKVLCIYSKIIFYGSSIWIWKSLKMDTENERERQN